MRKVYLVGAGPGDPDLITVKGLKAIQEADIILYDRLVNKELLKNARPDAKLVYCGKTPEHHTLSQEMINKLIVKYANQGKVVTRLKGGDPFIFGRGAEEAEVLSENNIPFEIVPGITAGSAVPSYAGIPLTHRDYSSSVAFITGVKKQGEDVDEYWEYLAKGADTICIYMGVKQLPNICEKLIQFGKDPDTPIAAIHCGTTENQYTITGTLLTITEKSSLITNPAIIVVGEVVRLRDKIQWFEWVVNKKDSTKQVSLV